MPKYGQSLQLWNLFAERMRYELHDWCNGQKYILWQNNLSYLLEVWKINT